MPFIQGIERKEEEGAGTDGGGEGKRRQRRSRLLILRPSRQRAKVVSSSRAVLSLSSLLFSPLKLTKDLQSSSTVAAKLVYLRIYRAYTVLALYLSSFPPSLSASSSSEIWEVEKGAVCVVRRRLLFLLS